MKRSSRKSLASALMALSLLGLCGLAQQARAELRERTLALVPQLAGFAELIGRETTLELNGHLLHLSTLTTERDAASMLARFAQLCADGARLSPAELRAAPSLHAGDPVGMLRERLPDGGAVAGCLASAGVGNASLLARLAAYRASGDAAELGQLRFVLVRPTPAGGSHVLLAWSHGPLRAAAMFPERGDAAGSDFVGLPRPHAARRVISAQVRGAAYGVVAHAVAGEPHAAVAGYLEQLARVGFAALPVSLETGRAATPLAAVVRGSEHAIVHGFRHHGQTLIAVTRTGKHQLERASATSDLEERHVE